MMMMIMIVNASQDGGEGVDIRRGNERREHKF